MTADELRRALEALGIPQRQFAMRLGVEAVTVNRWVTGKKPVPTWMAYLIELMMTPKNAMEQKLTKPTPAQIRFLDKVHRTRSVACADIGEWSARKVCERNGWLRHEPDPHNKHGVMVSFISDAGRAALEAALKMGAN